MKNITYKDTYKGIPIYNSPEGSSLEILGKTKKLLDTTMRRHNKVNVARCDLSYPASLYAPDNNEDMSKTIEYLKLIFKRQKCKLYYIWVRELSSTGKQHYHLMLLMNGNKIQNPYGVLQKVNEIWGNRVYTGPAPGLVHFCQPRNERPGNYGITIRRESYDCNQKYRECFLAASYLAKVYSKGEAPKRVREYGMSRL